MERVSERGRDGDDIDQTLTLYTDTVLTGVHYTVKMESVDLRVCIEMRVRTYIRMIYTEHRRLYKPHTVFARIQQK